jgi:hypothetical protein
MVEAVVLMSFLYEEASGVFSEEQWAILAPMFPEPMRRKDGRGPPLGVEPILFGGHTVDSAHGSQMARYAGAISERVHLLAPLTDVGRAGCVAACVAQVVGTDG